ncbi:choice-of-anchor D domain-containing protein [Anatilimnocola floriformis]|uniref:choice-of-anchor D domain-containing protein n=1 Tax=Anatilimnocola floriformis TaxID=2948575 RepID=UPI0020C225D7|nr:choice-of-anchor D domain-containing protein [Anatilimnocola floriformis]
MHRETSCRRNTHTISLLPVHNRRADDALRCKPQLETLEARNLMTVENGIDWAAMMSTSGVCTCPICTGQGLNSLAATEAVASAASGPALAGSPLSSLPQLSSNSGATAKLYLDFNGTTTASWGSYTNIVTPVYDQDGDRTTFSAGELNSITEIWKRVSEDYAPFNIDVTTIDPGNSTNGVTARIAIGGNYSDWFGQSAGGVAYIGGFYNSAPNIGFVFNDALANGNARYVAEAASHEAGHLFGLEHQATWDGNTLVAGYSRGTDAWAPIMGVGYYSTRTTWHNGATDNGPTAYQDDMSILANSSNGFGYKTDDFGSSQATASALAATNGNVNFAGLISTNTDQDWFSFSTDGGAFNLTANVATVGANLDSVLELRNASGTVIVTANPTNTFNATISTTLASGTYFVVVRSSGGYGDVGQYTLTGTAPIGTTNGGGGGGEDTSAPEINVLNGTTAIQTGGTVSFGSVQVGNFINKTLTIKNTGDGVLTLSPLTNADLPPGFSIVTNFGTNVLAAGASTTIVLRFTPTTAGATSGMLTLLNDDADEGSFAINLSGTATPAPAPEITVLNGTANVLTGGTINWGSVQVSKTLNKTITIKNTGNATLTLVKPTAADMPAGFAIVTNFAVTSLAAGASATITIRYTPTAVGAAGGVLNLVSNDADEGTFAINLAGTGTPGPQPEINVNIGSTAIQTGGTVDFGDAQLTKFVNKVITIKNTGTATLTLVKPTVGQMPPGFSIVTNFTVTSLVAGASASITLRYTPTALGSISGLLNLVSNDADEGTFAINLTGNGLPGPAPEINVNVGTTAIQSGDAINFGSVAVGNTANQTITIKNTGTAALTLVKPTAAQLPAGFTIVTNFATTSLAVGASATLVLRFTPTAIGAAGGVLNLVSNDADEGTFALNLTGTGTPAPIIRAIDNGAAGFTTTGGWTRVTNQGREADIQTAVKGTGTTTATWTFTALPPGQYRVSGSWTASVVNATNAPFTIYDGSTSLGTVLANQEVASSGLTWSGTNWKDLGTFNITGDTIRVVLTNAANDRVVADAIRVERIGDLPDQGNGAAAGSVLNFSLVDQGSGSQQQTVSTPTVSSLNTTPLFASLTSSLALPSAFTASVDEIFASNNDAQAELVLLNQAIDLLRTVESTLTKDSSDTTHTEATDELLADGELIAQGWNLL